MRILIVSQHFVPEITAGRFRMEAFAHALTERGHDVDVVCAVPNHPEGVIPADFRGRPIVRRRRDRLTVYYVWVKVAPSKTTSTRLASYGSYASMATLVGALLSRPDVILASSPPLSVGVVGAALAARHRTPLVLDVRDLWPKVATVLGELDDDGGLVAIAERVERELYRRASRMTTVTGPFRDHIVARCPTARRVDVVPNGTTSKWMAYGERPVNRRELGLSADRFILAYAGNLGYYHALDIAVAAAARLDDSFQLLLIGHGPLRDEIAKRAADLPPGRVVMAGLMKPEDAAMRLRAADSLLVSLRASLPDVLSSKLFDYCALGRPVIVSACGETRRVVEEAQAALTVEPEDAEAIAGAVRRLRDEPALGERLSRAGRVLAAEYLREVQAENMADILEQASCQGERAGARTGRRVG